MYFVGPFKDKLKRPLVALCLISFAMTATFGTLAHAYIGEDFDVAGQEHRTVHSIDLHEAEHGHSHDDELNEDDGQRHSHGHNLGDHSHEVPGVTVFTIYESAVVPSDGYIAFTDQHNSHAFFNIDRPPRR